MSLHQSTIIFTILLLTVLVLGFYRFGYNQGAPNTSQGILDLPVAPSVTPPLGSKGDEGRAAPKKSSSGRDGGESTSTTTDPPPPNNAGAGSASSGGQDPLVLPGEEIDPAVVAVYQQQQAAGALPPPPSVAGCIDLTQEESANQVELTRRMLAFRPSSSMARKLWSDKTPVFSSASPSSSESQPPIMKQWLYCYTKNYSGDPKTVENNDCTAELVDNAPTPIRNGKYFLGKGSLDKCTISPIYQGNITSWSTLQPVLTQFPGPLRDDDRTLKSIAESRTWYWKNIQDPFSFSCPTCRETKDLVHPSFLVGARRWWSIKTWFVLEKSFAAAAARANGGGSSTGGGGGGGERDSSSPSFSIRNTKYACFAILEKSFKTTVPSANHGGQCDGVAQPEPGDAFKWKVEYPFSRIIDVAFAFVDSESFFSITFYDKETQKMETHLLMPALGEPGVESFWLSMQMLFGFDFQNSKSKAEQDQPEQQQQQQQQQPRRGLFSNDITKPFFARNITEHYLRLKCRNLLLEYNSNSASASKLSRPLRDPFTSCWNDLIGLSSFDARANQPVWDPKKIRFTASSSSSPVTKPKKKAVVVASTDADEAGASGIGDVAKETSSSSLASSTSTSSSSSSLLSPVAQSRKENSGSSPSSPSSSSVPSMSAVSLSTEMQPTLRFPYLPCHPPYMTALVADARKNNNMDQHGLYWPFTCSRVGHRRPCLDDQLAKMLRFKNQQQAPKPDSPEWKKIPSRNQMKMSQLARPRVATCMAGFVRSFHLTRLSIFQNLVDPFDADFFAATWNVQGRAKKTDPVLKGHVISVPRMKQRIYSAIPKDRNVTALVASGRYGVQVFGYRMWETWMKSILVGGFRHAGLYMVMAAALKMAIAQAERTKQPYDIIIRGRFDLVPLVPMMFYPVWHTPDVERRANFGLVTGTNAGGNGAASDSNEEKVAGWVIDTGSSCEMDGFWWPRTAVLREGVVVAHTADTRYKLFSWQYCDWLHIGTYNTMKRLATLYDWALDNYVDSGAQFIEHAWAIDQGLRFYPMQLYLKILRETRKKPRKNGKKVLKIRMHLFG